MSHWPNQITAELRQFYGNPVGKTEGGASNSWQRTNLRTLAPSYPMYFPMIVGSEVTKRPEPITGIVIHRKCYDSLRRCLEQIKEFFTVEQITEYELDLFGRSYSYRRERGSSKLSIHAYGCAIDLSPLINKRGLAYNPRAGMMPIEVISFFKNEGWTWGGIWDSPDPMHFQAASKENE